ncbi:hypothetical protein [Shewanella surugensis]|uniref:Cytochrome c family protein n=1 Tax=Shewanella surugensis TaxID=212020 RepID=A0ABT0LGT5_9GAMM|nr:hypothetical protein [Shewanella surugensis]MCL1126903.1 hypothetical protein [Shewanella surugensis]
MMKSLIMILIITLSLSACMPKQDLDHPITADTTLSSSNSASQTPTSTTQHNADNRSNSDSASCQGDLAWLGSSSTLPTSVAEGNNCSFQQFAWQAFSYLLQTDNTTKQPRFLSWMPTYDIFVDEGDSPRKWEATTPTEDNTCQKVRKDNPERLYLSQTVLENVTIEQAGSNFPLIDQAGNFVYYDILVNEISYDFITQCDLYQSNCAAKVYEQYPSNGSGENNYANLRFPASSFVLKTAWMLNPKNEEDYFVIPGIISKNCQKVDLALVGMHVVGTTEVHKEFIWATFDHNKNAPDCELVESGNVPNDPQKPWNFYNPECKDCPRNTFQAGKPTQVCRIHPYGESTVAEQAPDNTPNMKQINQSMSDNITSSNGTPNYWANYELTGNVWSKNGNLPATTNFQRGSLASANVSMETYVQDGVATINPAFNCMSCHNVATGTQGTGRYAIATQQSNAAVSHLFKQVQPNTGGCTTGALPAACTAKYVK